MSAPMFPPVFARWPQVFEHEHVSTELKKQIQQARIAKKLTQAQASGQALLGFRLEKLGTEGLAPRGNSIGTPWGVQPMPLGTESRG